VNKVKKEKVRKIVRERYGKIAKTEKTGCGCGCNSNVSQQIGYSGEELNAVPEGADLNLGCGNPVALASLKQGETVLDLGSGGGLDCFLAARKVGSKGRVIGVDMTAEMLDRARANCKKGGYSNVEFRLGEIENLPVADDTADVLISNCVINLSPSKQRVFDEAFRVLKPGGRLMISDIVLLEEISEDVKRNVLAYVGCIAGAEMKDNYVKMIKDAGFSQVEIIEESKYPLELMLDDANAKTIMKELKLTKKRAVELANSVASIKVSAKKPQN
jgi:arsenite methyltransferase